MENDQWVTGKIKLRINGELVEMEMTVPAFPIKPHRMLPIFQQMSNAVVDSCVRAVEDEGKTVSCRAGCGACCRQAVPISEVEAYQIAELVKNMEEPRRTETVRRFADALSHFVEMDWFSELIDLADMSRSGDPDFSPKKYMDTVMKYFHEGVPCPFLENESCSIHADRPLSCREYLVTSPAENCKDPNADSIEKVPVYLRPSKAMLNVSRTANSEGISSLMLIEALAFTTRYEENFPERTGPEWAAEFFEQLTKEPVPDVPKGGTSKRSTRKRRKKRKKT